MKESKALKSSSIKESLSRGEEIKEIKRNAKIENKQFSQLSAKEKDGLLEALCKIFKLIR